MSGPPRLWWSPTRGLLVGEEDTLVRLLSANGLTTPPTHLHDTPADIAPLDQAGGGDILADLAAVVGAPEDTHRDDLLGHVRRLRQWADQVCASIDPGPGAAGLAVRGLRDTLKEWT